MVEAFLRRYPASAKTTDRRGGSPLHAAARGNHRDAMALLLQTGAEIDAPNSHGHTPLSDAAERGATEATALLLDLGADPNVQDLGGKTALHQTVVSGKIKTSQNHYEETAVELARRRKKETAGRTHGAGGRLDRVGSHRPTPA